MNTVPSSMLRLIVFLKSILSAEVSLQHININRSAITGSTWLEQADRLRYGR